MRITPKAATTAEHLESFARKLREEDLTEATVRSYSHDAKVFFAWLAESQPTTRLSQVAVQDLSDYRDHLVARKARPATINRRLEALRRLCRWAHETHILKRNVAQDLRPLRMVKPRRPRGLTKEAVHALLRTAGTSGRQSARRRNYALLQLMLLAGLRVGEMAALQVADVVLRDRTGLARVRQGKGRKAREVPLHAAARKALRSYLDGRGDTPPDAPLFVSSRGTALSVRSIEHTVTELAHRSGITDIQVSPHTLRHTFSINYLRANPGRLDELAALLGHDSLDTTAIYTRTSMDEMAQSLERIDVTNW